MTEIRGLLSKDKELGELKRDLARAIKNIPKSEFKDLDASYTEPLYLGFERKPKGVLLLSAIDARFQERAENVLAGGFCHWTWEGGQSRIRINSIDGLTPDPTTIMRMTFWVVG